jgi:hypothetical protein
MLLRAASARYCRHGDSTPETASPLAKTLRAQPTTYLARVRYDGATNLVVACAQVSKRIELVLLASDYCTSYECL